MGKALRHFVTLFATIIGLHWILSYSNEDYNRATFFEKLERLREQHVKPISNNYNPVANPSPPSPSSKVNAVIVILARNTDLLGVISSMRQLEHTFNSKHHYDYVFMNEVPFTDEFKTRTSEITDSITKYIVIPHDDWYQPSWINETKASAARDDMVAQQVMYGGSVSYRNMCRFNAGFFFRQEVLKPYKYYWRVEPDVSFYCDLDYDPFQLMQNKNLVYGFTITFHELEATIPTLWDAVKEFVQLNPTLVNPNSAKAFLSDDGGETYNECHFWSNFEIADLDFWRSEAYMKFFTFLDEKGGFYYERWGDAPIHSIAAALFASKEQVHFFKNIGYRHGPFRHCPQGDLHKKGKCSCNPNDNFDYVSYSCLEKWEILFK